MIMPNSKIYKPKWEQDRPWLARGKKALHALCNACGTQFKFDGSTTSQLDQHEKTYKHKNSMKTYSKQRSFTLRKGNHRKWSTSRYLLYIKWASSQSRNHRSTPHGGMEPILHFRRQQHQVHPHVSRQLHPNHWNKPTQNSIMFLYMG